MTSLATSGFWKRYKALSQEARALADKNYGLWRENPRHPALQFKPVARDYWSARVGAHHRALGRFLDGDTFVWVWIGTHEEYNKL